MRQLTDTLFLYYNIDCTKMLIVLFKSNRNAINISKLELDLKQQVAECTAIP